MASTLERLEAVAQRLNQGQAVQQSVLTDVQKDVLALKASDNRKQAQDESIRAESSLAGIFERLAHKSIGYKRLTGNAAMDAPAAFLNQRDADGRYVISDAKLSGMMAVLLQENGERREKGLSGHGIPFAQWMNEGGVTAREAIESNLRGLNGKGFDAATGDLVSKALTTASNSGGPLIRQDIAPLLYYSFLRKFPAFDAVRKMPSNGLQHRYDVMTDGGTATWLAELGDLAGADTASTYVQKTNSNIGVVASRRGISLKLQYATRQSGMTSFDLEGPDNLEVMAGIKEIARSVQAKFFQGNFSEAAGTISTENGAYDVNTFDGLRLILSDTSVYTGVAPVTKGSGQTYIDAINTGVAQVMNAGGDADNLMIHRSVLAAKAVSAELTQFYRVNDTVPGGGIASNLSANGIVTVSDYLSKFMNVPAATQAQGIGYYTYSGASTEDMYITDPAGMALAYLGSPTPVILELPVGYNSALSNVYVIFWMGGLVVDIPTFHCKVRIPKAS